MKILQLVAMAALTLGLTQMAYCKDGMHCDRKHAMEDADTNKDGAVSHDEFTAAHQKMADEMFTMMDTNKDGKIDQAERAAMHGKMGKKCNMKDHKMGDMKEHKMDETTK
jgi:IMP cyclohydrolase